MENVYENLYNQMKEQFTVENGNEEYTLGEYMMMRAGKLHTASVAVAKPARNVPAAVLRSFIGFIGEKMEVKSAPAPEKTIRSTPFRTMIASLACAMLVGTLFLSVALLRPAVSDNGVPQISEVDVVDEVEEVNL